MKRYVLCGLACLALAAGNASAATITWGSAFEIVGEGDIDVSGGVSGLASVQAANGGTDAGQVVNSVTFDAFTNGGGFTATTSTPSWLSLTIGAPGSHGVFNQASADTYSVPASPANTALDTILATHLFGDSVEDVTVTLNSLTAGHVYRVQIIAPADDRGCCSGRTVLVDGAVTINRFADIDSDTVSHVTSVIGTFTADAATQDILTSGANGGGFAALVLTETAVPEPASMVLMGLGGLLMLRRRCAA